MTRRTYSVLVACVLLLVACERGADPGAVEEAPSPAEDDNAATELALQSDDLVDLTLYFRSGEGQSAHLEPVTREVSVGQDLPRRAMELLIAGPIEGENGLDAPLPTTTHLRDLAFEGGTAHVELSPEAIRDAASVGDSPGNEALALAAIANTLTEFPSIDRVEVTVHGQGIDSPAFWGGWGLPGTLVRDESLIGPSSEGEGLLDLRRFSSEAQSTGSDEAGAVAVSSARVRDRLTHVRLAVQLDDPDDHDSAAKVPRSRVRRSGDEIVLEINDVAAYEAELGEGSRLDLSSESFRSLAVSHDNGTLTVRLQVADLDLHPFWLHSLSSPTRVIVDVKK